MVLKRKIIGWRYSRLVTLPKSWVELQGLNKGDVINMEIDKNGNIVIHAKRKA